MINIHQFLLNASVKYAPQISEPHTNTSSKLSHCCKYFYYFSDLTSWLSSLRRYESLEQGQGGIQWKQENFRVLLFLQCFSHLERAMDSLLTAKLKTWLFFVDPFKFLFKFSEFILMLCHVQFSVFYHTCHKSEKFTKLSVA